ncbi:methyltransferase domain-containing protein [Herpetosiphon gulosus]|uniref:Methyltransferase domain-containing protein n=1 Tax=Herpetosiphon gulosus TaxID=1973496 RepID=A0ABP9X302_9CHLR
MIQPDYEYHGLMAEAWDVLRGDTSGWSDRFFYRELIAQHGQPVLDIGCGTGRLLLDYLAEDIDIDGIDNSPDMLELCRLKAQAVGLKPNLYQQQLEDLNLPRQYATILIPSSSLQLITEPALVQQALQHVDAHLLAGGVVAASIMTLWQPDDPLESTFADEATRSSDGVVFRRESWSRFDPTSHCEATNDRYQKIQAGQVIAEELHQRDPATRSYQQAEIKALFEQAGFVEVHLYQGFAWQLAEPHEQLFCVVARKA